MLDPRGCRYASNPGLKLANAFGVILNAYIHSRSSNQMSLSDE